MSHLRLPLRASALRQTDQGRNEWETLETWSDWIPTETAVVVCDMWDQHWSRAMSERTDEMVVPMDPFLRRARLIGVQIIFAPSDTVSAYAGTPARNRMVACPQASPEVIREIPDVPLPIDHGDGGSDTNEAEELRNVRVWTRQHDGLFIDQSCDAISDDGEEIYSFMRAQGITHVLMVGAAVNMCILDRSFGIRNLVRWGFDVALVRDLTESMYNPAMPPYVSHQEGTAMVIGFIEKFLCPSTSSREIQISEGGIDDGEDHLARRW